MTLFATTVYGSGVNAGLIVTNITFKLNDNINLNGDYSDRFRLYGDFQYFTLLMCTCGLTNLLV